MSSRRPGRAAANSASCVAIDLGATAVRVVEIEWGKSGDPIAGARVLKRGFAPLPAGTWNDLDLHRDAVSAAIQHALAAGSISARSVVACLPRRLVTVRFLRLPPAPPEQMQGMVAYEAQPYLLFPLDEVILDYHVVVDTGTGVPLAQEDMNTVLLAAARRSVIEALLTIFDRAGLELRQLSVSALALAENIKDSIAPTALLDLEPGEMDVAVVANRQLMFTRASAVDTHGISHEAAQRRIVEEAFRSFTSYQNEFRNQPLAHIFYGGADQEFGTSVELERALSDALETPVQPLNSAVMRGADPDARTYLTAIGLAFQTRGGNIAGVNLVPRERAERRAEQSRGLQTKILVGVALAILALGGVSLQGYLTRQQRAQTQQLLANQKLDELSDRLDRRQKEFDSQSSMVKEVSSGLDRAHPSVDVLMALSSALPRTTKIWVTQFSFERDKTLTIRGESRSPSAPIELVLALQRSHAFINVRLTYLGDAQESENPGGQLGGATAEAGTTVAGATPLPPMNSATSAPSPAGVAKISLPPGGGGPAVTPPGTAPPPGRLGQVPAVSGRPAGGAPARPGPVPPISPPQGGIQPSVAPVPRSAGTPARNSGPGSSVLTSYIITCRVNTSAKTLLPPTVEADAEPGKGSSESPARRGATRTAATTDSAAADAGGDDAEAQ